MLTNEIKSQVHKHHQEIVKLNSDLRVQAKYCRQLFYTDALPEEMKHALARRTWPVKVVAEWAYENSADEDLLNALHSRAPLQISHLPFFVKNKNLNWEMLEKFLYLKDKGLRRMKVRIRLLEMLHDEFYIQHSHELYAFAKTVKGVHRWESYTVLQRLKKALDMKDAPEEWFHAMLTTE